MLKSKIINRYEKHDLSRICQGDILRDVKFRLVGDNNGIVVEIFFAYLVVISQDCDLDHAKISIESHASEITNKQFLPNIIFLPAFPSENVKNGDHLINIYNIRQEKLATDLWKRVIQNNNERYHYLKSYSEYQIPELVIDFKSYFTLPSVYFMQIYLPNYLATINELFREDLARRFSNYLSRIALPELE